MDDREQREDVHPPVNSTSPADGDLETAVDADGVADGTTAADGGTTTLEQVQRERDEYLDALQRSRAEFINFRRRNEQDAERNRQRATEALIVKLLPIADDFERALRMMPDDIAANSWTEGIRLVERKLWRVLEAEGITPMESLGQPFDPSRHEAVMMDDTGGNPDTVVEEYQRGYLRGNDVLRPAMVKVGAALEPQA